MQNRALTSKKETTEMKLLIISDMHSNPEALKAIIRAEGDADRIYFAGDFVDYGPDPCGAVSLASHLGVIGVNGNHDRRFLRILDADEYRQSNPMNWNDSIYGPIDLKLPNRRWVDQNIEQADAQTIEYLRALPAFVSITADGIAYLMSHQYDTTSYGTIGNIDQFNAFWKEHFSLEVPAGTPRRMIFGHTHRQGIVRIGDDALWMNPGSISYRRPDEASKDAFYITITDGDIEMKHVPYDRSSLYEAVLREKDYLHPDELRVAEFFFGWKEEDGPDSEWLEYKKQFR